MCRSSQPLHHPSHNRPDVYDIAITIDIDWAPDFIIDAVSEQLQTADVSATWFVTHRSDAVDRLSTIANFELGLHPNFHPGSTHGDTPEAVLEHLTGLLPGAKSIRTHGLVQSTNLIDLILNRTDVTIDASLFLPGASNLEPVDYYWKGHELVRLPYFWEDDFTFQNPDAEWDVTPYVNRQGLRIFDFHPIHIYLNSCSDTCYTIAKQRCPNLMKALPNDFAGLRNPGAGTASFFNALVHSAALSGSTTLSGLVQPTRRINS